MNQEPDPYAPPQHNPEPGPDVENLGQGWRVEQGRLLVRDHARLPDVCLLGGMKGEPGRRIFLNLKRPGGRVRVVAFCCDQRKKRVAWRRVIIGNAIAVVLVALIWWSLSLWSVPVKARWIACILVASFSGMVETIWRGRKEFRILRSEEGWHELSGVDPTSIEALGRIDRGEKEPSEA